MSFKDKVVVVTGGSRGFGRAMASMFVQSGAKVTITSANEAELKTTAEAIGADYIVADAGSFDDQKMVAEKVLANFNRIDVWVNNAGVQIAPSNIEEVDIAKLRKLFDINFFGYYYGSMIALKIMKKQASGMIVNINSTAGLSGKPGLSAYVSSKFAIKGMSESIREEIKGTDVSLYQIFPGGMKTDIYHEMVPVDIDEYMDVDYAITKVMENFLSIAPEIDLIIKRPKIL
jgi:NAD(P)-dependent dehydrogenase (short-subunit alcohol dehydrogenase family)